MQLIEVTCSVVVLFFVFYFFNNYFKKNIFIYFFFIYIYIYIYIYIFWCVLWFFLCSVPLLLLSYFLSNLLYSVL